MAGIADVVDVQITSTSARVREPGFGVPLIVDAHNVFPERVRYYTDAADLLADGFTTASAAYLAAQKLTGQNPQVERFGVGRRSGAAPIAYSVTPTAVAGAVYRLTAGAVSVAYAAEAGDTAADIADALAAELGSIAGWTVASASGVLTITADAAGSWLAVSTDSLGLLAIEQTQAAGNIADDLAAINLESSDWYALTLTSQGAAEILAAAAWTEANGKLFVAASSDSEIVTEAPAGATDVAAQLASANYARTALIYHPRPQDFIGAAWLGKTLPLDPGSLTFKFKTLAGVTAGDLTTTHEVNAKSKNANLYLNIAGVSVTLEGVVAAGEFIDVVRDTDWFTARLQTRIFTDLANAAKLPYTDAGIAVVEAQVRAQLAEAIAAGFIAENPEPLVQVPRASSVPQSDKLARRLTGITFEATLAGAIHSTQIRGSITV